MSMIGAQIDELRKIAGDGSMEWVAGPIRASVLRDAADTIWQLRDDLQRANDAVRDAEHDESRAWDRVRKAEADADRLRELVRDALTTISWCTIDCCPSDNKKRELNARARELGVEVDG